MASKDSWERPKKEIDKLTKEQIELCRFAKYLWRTYQEASRAYKEANRPWVDARQYYDGKADVALFAYRHFVKTFNVTEEMLEMVKV